MQEPIKVMKIVCLVLAVIFLGMLAFNIFGGEPEPVYRGSCENNTTASVPACFEIKFTPTPIK